MKRELSSFLNFIHAKVFGHAIGKEMKKFVRSLGIVGATSLTGGFLLFLVNVITGRYFGPSIYGEFQVIQAIANILVIFMLGGIHVAIARGKEQKNQSIIKDNKNGIFSAAFVFVIILSLIVAGVVYGLRNKFEIMNIDSQMMTLGIMLACALGFYNLFKSYFQFDAQFKQMAFFELFLYIVIFVVYVLFYIFLGESFSLFNVILSFAIGYLFFSFITFFYKRKSFQSISFSSLRPYLRYGYLIFFIAAVGVMINNIDRIIANYYLSSEEVGLYGAYFFTATLIVIFLARLFNSVFFPTVSQISEKGRIVVHKKIFKIEKIGFPVVFIISLMTGYVLFKLYGRSYEFRFDYLVTISLMATFLFFTIIRQWFLVSFGSKGARIGLAVVAIVAALSLLYYILLVSRYGIDGAFIAALLTNVTFYSFNVFMTDKFIIKSIASYGENRVPNM